MATLSCTDIGALQDLLEQDVDVLRPSQTQVVPRVGAAAVASTSTKANEDAKRIWDDDEVPSEEALGFMFDPNDQRLRADFKMFYKQLVNSEDVYLGTEKTPSSAHSHAIVYKISFPDHRQSEIDVDVTKTTLRAESARLKLALYLPQPVHADYGQAHWDPKTCVLTITLPLASDEW